MRPGLGGSPFDSDFSSLLGRPLSAHLHPEFHEPGNKDLEVDSPFFSTIVLFKNRVFPLGFGGFLKRRIPGKNEEGSRRKEATVPAIPGWRSVVKLQGSGCNRST